MDKDIRELIERALQEDIGTGDITSKFLFEENFVVDAALTAKEKGIICGVEIFKAVFLQLSPGFKFKFRFKDGDRVAGKNLVAEITGPVKEMMAGERTALNFLQRLSGIATLTGQLTGKSGRVDVYDTRKTTPLLRKLEKYAVRTGGGRNHRFGLYDMVLIKDNHIFAYMQREKIKDRAEAIRQVVGRAKEKAKGKYRIEVEVENFSEAREGFLVCADIVMFDNADTRELRKFVKFLGRKRKEVVIEWSGNIALGNIKDVKKLPVDRVSIGAVTHSSRALDFSLKVKGINQIATQKRSQ